MYDPLMGLGAAPIRRFRLPFLLLMGLGLLMALTSIVTVAIMFTSAEEARAWPTTTGRIEATEIRSVELRRVGTRYEQHVEYSYTVAGHAYRGGRIAMGGRAMSADRDQAAADLARHYRPGQSVQVYYDPDDPANAILEQDSYFIGPFLGLPIGALLIAAALVVRRRSRLPASGRRPADAD